MQNAKIYIIIFLIVVLILLAVFFIGKYKGKQYAPETVILPSDIQGSNVPTNWNPGSITDGIYHDLDTYLSHDATPYNDALALSNSQLVAVHNDWNKRYFKEFGNMTLVQAIQDESTVWNYAWSSSTGALVNKLKSLGL